jgi:hypothetical protein
MSGFGLLSGEGISDIGRDRQGGEHAMPVETQEFGAVQQAD